MSHGLARSQADKEKVITSQYRMLEASITPQGPEANPWTKFTAKEEANVSLSAKKKEFLEKYLGKDALAAIEADTDALKKAAEAAGVEWKDVLAIQGKA